MTTTVTEPTGATEPTADQITMYSTTWCGYCRRLKSQLDREGIGFAEVDIEQVPDAAEYVMSVNGGNQTVPTVVVISPTGEKVAMTNPSLAQVKAAAGL
jgi:mycoredoxin